MSADRKPQPTSGDEYDWVIRAWRRSLCVFHNNTGLGRAVKRAMNKRFRRNARQQIRECDE